MCMIAGVGVKMSETEQVTQEICRHASSELLSHVISLL